MSELRQRKAAVDEVNTAPSPRAEDDVDVKEVDPKSVKLEKGAPATTATSPQQDHRRAGNRAGGGKSFLGRHGTTILPVVLTLFAAVILPKLSQLGAKHYPPRYGLCTFDGAEAIYTDALSGARAQCVVVDRDRIAFVGSIDETRRIYGDADRYGRVSAWSGKKKRLDGANALKIYMVDRGYSVIPGLTDAHGHILDYGHTLTGVHLQGADSVNEVIRRVVAHIDTLPADRRNDLNRVIEGQGFDQTKWPGAGFPTAKDLDVPELKGRKIFLVRVDLHACWISPALLDTLDIPEEIPGGIILRDTQGKPTGVFLDTAYEWIKDQLPPWTDEDRANYLMSASKALLSQGIVAVHDARVFPQDAAFFKKLDEKQLLPIRIYGMIACEKLDEYCGDQVERYEGGRFTLRSVKLFLDGALGSWGAAMLTPYSDKPEEKGILRIPEEKLTDLVQKWIAKGFQVNTHAIGNAANRMVVKVYKEALAKVGKTNHDLRLRIEHAQILTVQDIEKAGKLGLIASFQPTHGTSDMGYAEERLGPERIKGAYAWQSLYEAGAPIAIGSDFPVEDINPFEGIYSSITRLDKFGTSPHGPDGWYPKECLTREQALHGFTTGAAYAGFAEHQQGKLKVGMKADITIVDRDIMKVTPRELRGTKVQATILDGRVVYGKL